MSQKPKCKFTDTEHFIMNAARTMAITLTETIELEGYRTYRWDEFKEIYEAQALDLKLEFSLEHLKDAKSILKGMGLGLEDCIFHYCRQHPLIIDTDTGWSIAISPKVLEE